MTLERLCPVCRWEGIWLPGGGLMCAEHGRYDAIGDQARDIERGREAALAQAANVKYGATPPTCPDCGGSGLRVDAYRRAGESLTDAEAEVLDSTRCHLCCGDGHLSG